MADQFIGSMEELDDFLSHAGVKGMRWGVRKAGSSVKSGASTLKKKYDDADETTKTLVKGAALTATLLGARALGSVAISSLSGHPRTETGQMMISQLGGNLNFAPSRGGVSVITSFRP